MRFDNNSTYVLQEIESELINELHRRKYRYIQSKAKNSNINLSSLNTVF